MGVRGELRAGPWGLLVRAIFVSPRPCVIFLPRAEAPSPSALFFSETSTFRREGDEGAGGRGYQPFVRNDAPAPPSTRTATTTAAILRRGRERAAGTDVG